MAHNLSNERFIIVHVFQSHSSCLSSLSASASICQFGTLEPIFLSPSAVSIPRDQLAQVRRNQGELNPEIMECYAHQLSCNIFESLKTRKYCHRFWCAYHSFPTFSPPPTSLRNRPSITVQIHKKKCVNRYTDTRFNSRK